MNKSESAYERFIRIVMYAAFVAAFGWGVLATALSLRDTGQISLGVALSAVGVYFAIGVFYSMERMHRRTDRSVNEKFDEVLHELKKRECKCQAQCCADADAEEAVGKSWLVDLLCGGARR